MNSYESKSNMALLLCMAILLSAAAYIVVHAIDVAPIRKQCTDAGKVWIVAQEVCVEPSK